MTCGKCLGPYACLPHLRFTQSPRRQTRPAMADPPRYPADHPISSTQYNQRWHDIWDNGLEPGKCFDASNASAALLALLDNGLDVRGKRSLVPGCGRGYDVAVLASRGAHCTGLELSENAIKAAEEYKRESNLGECADNARFVSGDFFEFADPAGPFDLGYDYTFLCALHPSMRAGWAPAWARLLKPGGELITLMFPLPPAPGTAADTAGGGKGGETKEEGPPWPLTPQLYRELLLPNGFGEVSVVPVPPEQSHAGREGREMLGRWRRL